MSLKISVFQVMAAFVLAASGWMVKSKLAYIHFLELLKPEYEVAEEISEPYFLQRYSYVFLGFGATMFLITCIGYIISVKECRKMIFIYGFVIIFILCAQIIAYLLAQIFNDQIPEELPELLDISANHYNAKDPPLNETTQKEIREAWALIQEGYHCCGKDNYMDFQTQEEEERRRESNDANNQSFIPKSCCKPEHDCTRYFNRHNSNMMKGCFHSMENMMSLNKNMMLAIGVGFSITKIVLLIITCYIFCKYRDGKCVYSCGGTVKPNCPIIECLTKKDPDPCAVIQSVVDSCAQAADGDAPTCTVVEVHTTPKETATQNVVCLPVCPPEVPPPCPPPLCPPAPCLPPPTPPSPPPCTTPPPSQTVTAASCPPSEKICCPVKVCGSTDALTMPIVVPDMKDQCCLEMQVRCRELQIMYMQEKQLLEHKLHHRQQIIWNQELYRRKELVKREEQLQYKATQMTVDQDLQIRDLQARMDKEDMFQERDLFQQEQVVARARQQLLMQREVISEESDEASQRRARAFNICVYRPLACPDLGFIQPEVTAQNQFLNSSDETDQDDKDNNDKVKTKSKSSGKSNSGKPTGKGKQATKGKQK